MFELDKNNFEEEVLKATGPVLVDFYGNGCVPCEALKPHILRLEEEYGDRIRFTGLNTSNARRLAISQRILGLPVIAIYENGEKTGELVKEDASPEAVEDMLKEFCADRT
ncbi:MAG TPA: thioredoxin family protein [Bacillota bacterium]|jgi:thioredoxin 1|nr:thioredoxin family protein [Fastidiosipila sp.]HPX92664.1 thioredoxin family protein [Bacillota bacterium]HQB81031.1 thioredoxin family protein [Bacillota bacterium]